ncbi:MAG: Dickkopf N-terminal cysteine-rich domain-containing protein [Pseudomonadota bacterium]
MPGFGGTSACNYDECFTDSDCGQGSVCQCRDPADGNEANYCTKVNGCVTDADCGADGYCSPSQAHEWCSAFYVCHSAQDECLNDGDCAQEVHCDFDAGLQHWACGNGCGGPPP